MKFLVVRPSGADASLLDTRPLLAAWPQAAIRAVDSRAELERALTDEWYDAILTGYCLAWGDGFEALDAVRQRQPNTPVVMATALGSEELAVRAWQAGMHDYLTPASIQRLPQSIQKCLEAARRRRVQLNATLPAAVEIEPLALALKPILDTPSDLVLLLDIDGKLIFANDTFLHRAGKTPETIRDLSLFDVLPRELAERRMAVVQEVAQNGAPVRFEDRGVVGWYDNTVYPIAGANGQLQCVAVIARDITELKSTQMALEKAGEELACRVEERTAELSRAVERAEALAQIAARLNAPTELQDVVQTLGAEALRVSRYQSTCVYLVETESDDLRPAAACGLHSPALMQLSPLMVDDFEAYFRTSGAAQIIPDAAAVLELSFDPFRVESGLKTIVILRLMDGEVFLGVLALYAFGETQLPSEEELTLLLGLANLGATAIAKALLFRQVVESRSRLQTLSHKLVEIQDLERRNLAVELHDQVGQMLTSLRMKLEQIRRALQDSGFQQAEQLAQEVGAAEQQVQTVLEQVRQLSLELRPPMLDELGLLPALLTYIDKFCERTQAKVDFRHSGLYNRLDGAIEKALYRMVQEGLTNVVRHSGVKEASVRILRDEKRLVAQVRDEGRGFDADITLNERLSTGLSGMGERVALCGGDLTIESEPGKGTCLTAEFLLEPRPARLSESEDLLERGLATANDIA